MITKLEEMFDILKGKEKVILAVAAAQDENILLAIKDAIAMEIITPILVGNEEEIRSISNEINLDLENIRVINRETFEECAEVAVRLVSSKQADFVMKGLADTAIILKAVLNKEWGLRGDGLLSHMILYEASFYHKLLMLTDGGMNISPDYDDKVKIIKNAIKAFKPLQVEKIKVACLAAKEKVNPKMPATVDAKRLEEACKNGEFGDDIIVEGPLAFDLAVSKKSCEVKKFKTEVGGDADIILVPYIEVGNAIGKVMTYAADAKNAGIVMGAKCPIVVVSRSASHESKLYSIAYGAIITLYNKENDKNS